MLIAPVFLVLGVAEAKGLAEVTPVQKVIELMNGMLAKGKSEKHDEQVQFAAYKQFCDDTTVEKKRAIAEANEQIDVLKADIEKYTATAAKLSKEIAEHEEDISVWNGDVKAATKVREIEKADYDATHTDYSESVDALQRAIAVLKKQSHDRKQASLIQLKKLKLIPDDAKKVIDIFLQQDPDEGLAVSAPEANAYEFQSGGVVEMLEKLLDKFIEERTTLEKEEMNAKHAYDMLMQDLNAQVSQAETDRDEKAEFKADTLQSKADATGDLQDTTTTRAEEIEAVEKAIEIVSSGAVSGNADKHLPGLVQTSFAQLRADSASMNQQRVATY